MRDPSYYELLLEFFWPINRKSSINVIKFLICLLCSNVLIQLQVLHIFRKQKLDQNWHLHGTRIVALDIFSKNHVQQTSFGCASIEYNPFYPVGKTRSNCQCGWPNNWWMANHRPNRWPIGHVVGLGRWLVKAPSR